MNKISKIFSSRCWVSGKLQPATVCFEDGTITDVLFSKDPDAYDAGDNILMPGIIDAHAHINEPGRTEWEGFDTATRAAAAGGITTVVDMPLNASPVTTTLEAFNTKLKAAENKLHVNVGFYGGLIPGNTDQLENLINAGVLGIKCFLTHSGIDEFPNVTEKDLDEAMPIIAKHKIPLLVHCELESACDHSLKEFPSSYREYLASRPKDWENNAIALMIRLCRKYNCPVHIVHVASSDALTMIADAKSEGLPLTAETCPHYIYFSAEKIPDGKCVYKCAPPIREEQNNDLLKDALVKGVLDFIATDHSPATPGIKETESGNFLRAWGGIAGIQFLLPASWTALKDRMSLEQFIPLLTEHPAKFIGAVKKGKIEKGSDADLMIWNPDEKRKISADEVLFRHKISPYIGEELYGSVTRTIVNGITVFNDDHIAETNAGRSFTLNKTNNENIRHPKQDL